MVVFVGDSFDDIIIAGETKEVHDRALSEVFETAKNNITLKKEKNQYSVKSVKFMNNISTEGIKADPDKIKAIVEQWIIFQDLFLTRLKIRHC